MKHTKAKWFAVGAGTMTATVLMVGYYLLFPGISFLLTYMDEKPDLAPVVEDFQIPADGRMIPARRYAPDSSPRGTIVLIHGVHSDGYNEKRLLHFTESLVKLGFQVVTPDIEDLRKYEIEPRAVDDIRTAATWVLHNRDLVSETQKIGLWGISFAGGLCLSLAGSEGLKDRVISSFSFGGHGDLDTTIEYLMTGKTPTGKLPPHVYGQAVLVRRYAHQLVPTEQQQMLKDTVLRYLQGDYKAAQKMSQQLPEESRRYSRLIFSGNEKTLGRYLATQVRSQPSPAVLSAIRNPPPKSSVFLLHGSLDNVIPPHESAKLAAWASKGKARVHLLISPLINHVELEEDSRNNQIWAYLDIIRFWTALIRSTSV